MSSKSRLRAKSTRSGKFRFVYEQDWEGPGMYAVNSARPKITVLAQYSEPFYSECRAFGRLHEAGYPELANPCYGYVLLDEAHESKLADRFKLEFNGNIEMPGYEDMRGRYPGERSGKPPPLRGILKKFGSTENLSDPANLSVPTARRLLRDVIQLHRLGIFYHDLRRDQLVDNKMSDFSTAFTVPHFMATPELNPELSPGDLATMEHRTFLFTIGDYWAFEQVVLVASMKPRQKAKLLEKVPVFPGGVRVSRSEEVPYNLRSSPFRDKQKQRVYTLADPRQYVWKAAAAAIQRRQKLRLPAKPERWYLNCVPEKAVELAFVREFTSTLEWRVNDAGLIFPVTPGYGRCLYEKEQEKKAMLAQQTDVLETSV
ncbi:hypothetical protein SBRCBS47491_006393 [Sporothrix bragantina]|uniref:Protein kinase domain-containing protein n=1 Tax=Sporothrix bragantina TaxID=671064 RepID=A0ABP0C6Z6_9PEZI